MTHPRQLFDSQLQELEAKVVRLGAVVEGMLEGALRSVISRDDDLAETVVRDDDEADQLDMEIEQDCIRLLALQQPLSHDLRRITTIIKIIADLERIGDYSVDIAKTGQRMPGATYFQPMVDIQGLGRLALDLVRNTLRAFVDRDLELAQRICALDDDEIDDLHDHLFEELIARMERNSAIAAQAARFLLISRYLERIADHCTNIAERTYYMETGRLEDLKMKKR